jgi:hypothetical protein
VGFDPWPPEGMRGGAGFRGRDVCRGFVGEKRGGEKSRITHQTLAVG